MHGFGSFILNRLGDDSRLSLLRAKTKLRESDDLDAIDEKPVPKEEIIPKKGLEAWCN